MPVEISEQKTKEVRVAQMKGSEQSRASGFHQCPESSAVRQTATAMPQAFRDSQTEHEHFREREKMPPDLAFFGRAAENHR